MQLLGRHACCCACAGEFAGLTKELYVEPLVGHLRHPHGLKECVGVGDTVRMPP
jgi:hypothetical protein